LIQWMHFAANDLDHADSVLESPTGSRSTDSMHAINFK